MRIESSIFLLIVVLFCSCEKNELPQQPSDPKAVFGVDFVLNGEQHTITAGPDNVVAQAEIIYDDFDIPLLHSDFGIENCESCFSRLIEFEISTNEYNSGLDFSSFINDLGDLEVVSDLVESQDILYQAEIENLNPSSEVTIDFLDISELIETVDGVDYLNLNEGPHQLDYTLNFGFYTNLFDLSETNYNYAYNASLLWKENGVYKLKIHEQSVGISEVSVGILPDVYLLEAGEILEIPEGNITGPNFGIQVLHQESNLIYLETFFVLDIETFETPIPEIELNNFEFEFQHLELFENSVTLKYFDDLGVEYVSIPTAESFFEIKELEYYAPGENDSELYNAVVEFSVSCQNDSGETILLDSEESNIPIRFREN